MRAIGTSSQTESPSRLISARLSGSANVPPPVATTTWRSGSRSRSTWRSTCRKYGSPWLAKIVANVRPSRASMRSSMSSARQSRRAAERAREGRLARAHESDQIDLVSRHGRASRGCRRNRDTRRPPHRRRSPSSGPEPPGRQWQTPSRAGGRAPRRRAAGEARAAADVKAVGEFVDVGAHGAQARGERRDAVALLDASSPAPVTCSSPPAVAIAARAGNLVDEPGNVLGTEDQRPQAAMANADAAARLALVGSCRWSARPARRRGPGRRTAPSGTDSARGRRSSTSDPGSAAAATAQNVADDTSPGTGRLNRVSAAGRRARAMRPSGTFERGHQTRRPPIPYDLVSATGLMHDGASVGVAGLPAARRS